MTTVQIFQPKWILTGLSNQEPLENHALVIKDGLIEEVIPIEIVKERYPKQPIQLFSTHIMMPGLVNCHTHLAMNYFRGLADDLTLMDWLHHHIWPAEKKWVSHEFVKDASLFAMAEMIRSGTTCFNDMYFFLDAIAEATDIAGMRGCIGMTVIDVPTAWAKTPEEYLEKGLAFYEKYKNHPLITPTLAPHAPYTVSDETLLRVKEISDQYHLKINMHIHETADEVNRSLEQYHMRPLKRLHQLGLISSQLIAIHMTQLNKEDLEIIEVGKPQIVHCPESNMKLASGICPVTTLELLGMNVALGSDGAASNNDLDMLGEMRSAAFLAKLSTQKTTSLPASHVIHLATAQGARVLGLDAITGTLEAGKAADFIAIQLDEIETLPTYHPTSQIVYAACRTQVTHVWVNGKQLLKNRELTTIDIEKIKNQAHHWKNRLEEKKNRVC